MAVFCGWISGLHAICDSHRRISHAVTSSSCKRRRFAEIRGFKSVENINYLLLIRDYFTSGPKLILVSKRDDFIYSHEMLLFFMFEKSFHTNNSGRLSQDFSNFYGIRPCCPCTGKVRPLYFAELLYHEIDIN